MITWFGLFMVLAFAGAYFAFRAEYRRKGIDFKIAFPPPATRRVPALRGSPFSAPQLLVALIAGVAAAKFSYWCSRWGVFIGGPQDFVFSLRGDWWVGFGVAVVVAALYRPGRLQLELMDGLLLYCGLAGFAGALLLAAFEDPRHIGFHGLNFYGALLAGTAAYLTINRRHGISLATAADIGSPGMMLAYGIGRMGCHLAGDGDWGVVNGHMRPSWLSWLPDWAWAWRYPHNSVRQGEYIPGCSGGLCTQLVDPVYPTPLYEAVICLLLFGVLWALRRRIKQPGMLFALYAVLNGGERFLVEMIRVTPRYEWAGLSQAQLIAVAWVVTGLVVAARRRTATLLLFP